MANLCAGAAIPSLSNNSGGSSPPSTGGQRAGFELLLLSAVILFLELAVIRWGGAKVRVLAYFPNLLLIGSFLGLGLGCMRAGRASLAAWWMPLVLTLVTVYTGLGRVVFTQSSAAEHLWLLYYDLGASPPVVNNVWLPVVGCFVLAVLAFIPAGQLVAERLIEFKRRERALTGYGWDLAGSLTGAVGFAVVSMAQLAPVHWFAIALTGVVWFARQSISRVVVHVGCAVAALTLIHVTETSKHYSPYYGLTAAEAAPGNMNRMILANGSLHQIAIRTDLGNPHNPKMAEGYHHPYTVSGHRPRRALVLGAGTGNDVATLLQQGAEHIDVVEIDPVIIQLGREVHPNRPYESPRVRIFNTDARAFLNDNRTRYDTIVFGTLDSMTRLSALSNVRLDNFVYSLDALRAAAGHLTDDGALILYFMAPGNFIDDRITVMLAEVFGRAPLVHTQHYSLFNYIYMAGPAFDKMQPAGRRLWQQVLDAGVIKPAFLDLPNDDWPFLYLAERKLSAFYWQVIAWIAGLSLLAVLVCSPELRQNLRQRRGMDVPMFCFGLGFLLLETRAVTAMNLVWGSTWLTSAVVFAAILFTVLAGTLGHARVPLRFGTSMAGLGVSLLALYALPNEVWLTLSVPVRLATSLIAIGLPVLFASTAFARVYADRTNVGQAFGWNLLGAVAGGLLEFSSMVFGLRALLLLALAAYAVAFLFRRREEAVSRASRGAA